MSKRCAALWEIGDVMVRLRAADEWDEQHFRNLFLEARALGESGDDLELLSMYSKREWRVRLREDLKKRDQQG